MVLLGMLLCASCPGSNQESETAPVASASPARFEIVSDTIVRDTKTGFEWTRRDDGAGLEWHKAEAYCRDLKLDDAGGWRLPDVDELYALYEERVRQSCGEKASCSLDSAFTLTSPYVWTGTARDPATRFYIDFQFGTRLSPSLSPVLVRRTLCVRRPGEAAPSPRPS
jgi:hypothetical protein